MIAPCLPKVGWPNALGDLQGEQLDTLCFQILLHTASYFVCCNGGRLPSESGGPDSSLLRPNAKHVLRGFRRSEMTIALGPANQIRRLACDMT
jgi:hypothetical protein